ncbi:MAG: gamma-glutamylputrescine oxidase [Sphingobacteriales bacterium]|jgi:gamma-glutamylputrescine oxidase
MQNPTCFWEQQFWPKNPDFTIIGAGIVGLSAAIEIKKRAPKASVHILEKSPIGAGASSRNAGFTCFGSPTELLSDLKVMPAEELIELIQMRWSGLQILLDRCGKTEIEYHNWGSTECFLPDANAEYHSAKSQLPFLNELIKDAIELPECFSDLHLQDHGFNLHQNGFFNQYEGQIDTGKMYQKLEQLAMQSGVIISRGANIESIDFEDHPILHFQEQFPAIRTKNLLICTNGFSQELMPNLDCFPARAQVLVSSPINQLPFKGTFHMDEGYYYFRNIGNRVLLGGGRNLDIPGETSTNRTVNEKIQIELEKLLRNRILPKHTFNIDYQWTGIMGTGKVKKPIIEKKGNHCLVGVRLGGMGVAIGSHLGNQMAKIIV